MTTSAETFLDTNILLAATTPARSEHAAALAALEAGFSTGTLLLSGQVIREYLAVATRPTANNGLGLAMEGALGNVAQIAARARCLDENADVRRALLDLLRAVPCSGKQVHDANIVATMLAHGVPRLLTLNGRDFGRFEVWIQVLGLRSYRRTGSR